MSNKGYLAVLTLFCIFCSSASAQTHTSTVFGNVRDESGPTLQAVEIQIVEENTQRTRNTMSGRNGSFFGTAPRALNVSPADSVWFEVCVLGGGVHGTRDADCADERRLEGLFGTTAIGDARERDNPTTLN